jgi:hypothetical protein
MSYSLVHLIMVFLIRIARKITAFNKICTHHQYIFLKFGTYLQNKNVYSLMFMLVIIHRAYVLKLFLGTLHLDRNHGCLQD